MPAATRAASTSRRMTRVAAHDDPVGDGRAHEPGADHGSGADACGLRLAGNREFLRTLLEEEKADEAGRFGRGGEIEHGRAFERERSFVVAPGGSGDSHFDGFRERRDNSRASSSASPHGRGSRSATRWCAPRSRPRSRGAYRAAPTGAQLRADARNGTTASISPRFSAAGAASVWPARIILSAGPAVR